MARKPKGHKKTCRCPFCKRARGGKSSARSKGGTKHTAAERRKRAKELRTSLREAKTGEKAAARNGDAKSWSSFKSKRKALEGQIKRL